MSKKSKSKPSNQPVERREPSERDREIYSQVKAGCKMQVELAQHHGMSKSRVSQIVKKVEAWFADASPRDGELDHGQRLRLERRLERERLELLYGESVRMMREFEKPAEATRTGDKGTETTKREERNSRLQALKCAIRTTESLGKLAEREPAPLPPGEDKYVHPGHLYAELRHRREQAEEQGRAPVSGDSHAVVYYLLGALEGDLLLPVQPGSGVQTALTKMVEVLEGCGAQAGSERSEVGGPRTEEVGWDQAAAAAGPPCVDQLSTEYSVLRTPYLPDAGGGASAQLAQLTASGAADEIPPEVAAVLVASGWRNAGYDDNVPAESSPEFSRIAGENSAELSAGMQDGTACPPRASSGTEARPGPPPEVGSPEWKVARAKWLKERDLRARAEHDWRIRERLAREADLRERRAAAGERWRWIEAGRAGY